jgi:hypothetical protein
MKKLTTSDWDKLQSERPARYFVQSVEDGPLKVAFDSEIFVTERGDEDILGNVWDHEWKKVEANVTINGEHKIYSFGATTWSFINEFIAECRKNDITPEQLPGHMFEIKKLEPFKQTIKYLGKTDEIGGATPSKSPDFKDNTHQNILDVIGDLKHNSPDLIKNGLSKAEFIKICSIRGQLKSTQVDNHLLELVSQGHLRITGDKVFVV